jgi:hypothetical protein
VDVGVLLEIDGDAAGDLMQVGGSREQAGQVLQLRRGKLIQSAGDIDLGRVPQQQDDQVAVPALTVVQPGAAALARLLVAELARVGHQAHLLLLLLVRVRRSRERRRMRARPLRSCRSS